MARRPRVEEPDVTVREDPLRVQNRRLSVLVLILGALVVIAVLWATDPNRSGTAVSVAVADNPFVAQTDAAPTQPGLSGSGAIPTVVPTATLIPEALRSRGSIVYTLRERGQTDLWAVNVGSRNAVRITNSREDDRDPAWNPDGTRLAYASRNSGNWDLYVYDLRVDAPPVPVTFDLSFQARPSWSPDSLWLAFESYQSGNLDIFAVKIDTSEPPQQITDDPAADFSPAWSPSGREIAFVSWREGNQDVYVINLDDRSIRNITNTPTIQEDYPAWSPDGRYLAYSAFDQGAEKVFVREPASLAVPATVISFGRAPVWSPDGSSLAFAVDATDRSRTDIQAVTFLDGGVPTQMLAAPFGATSVTWSSQVLPPPLVTGGGLPPASDAALYEEQTTTFDGRLFRLQSLGNVQANQALLSDTVDNSFVALRQRMLEIAGRDFLGQLDDAYWGLDRRPEPGEPRRNWHLTGRAFAIARSRILGFPPEIEIVREDLGVDTFWRVFVRVDDRSQSGQLGEPLRRMPWDFLSATEGDVEAYNQGGRLRSEMPAGYYVDFSLIAEDYGWERVAAASDWRANDRVRNYWLVVHDGDLTWCEAMLQIYNEDQIANFECVAGQ
jgi:TolB protein